jgi:tetratricopeptide (TPR) repeat protein
MRKRVFLVALLLILPFSPVFISHSGADDNESFIARGIQEINIKQYNSALRTLKKALKLSPDNPEATYYTGIAYSRLGQYSKAEQLLIKTIQLDDTASEAYFELGLLYYKTGSCDKAEEILVQHNARSHDSDLKESAEEIMARCLDRDGGIEEEKPYKVNIILGGQYDSNVIIEPDDPTVERDRKFDYRAIVNLKAFAAPLKRRYFQVNIRYNFYQSVHVELSDYNMTYHDINPEIELNVSDIIKPLLGYSFADTSFGGDRYSRIHTVHTKIRIAEGKRLATDLLYEYRDKEYRDIQNVSESNSLRTGDQNTAGIRQNYYHNRVAANIYYYYDSIKATEGFWSYDGHRGGTAIVLKLIDPLNIIISGEYNERRYRDEYPGFFVKRVDRLQQYSVGLKYKISSRVDIYLKNVYIKNNSNLGDFDYKRNITSLLLRAAIL